jgi:hypothetical protein
MLLRLWCRLPTQLQDQPTRREYRGHAWLIERRCAARSGSRACRHAGGKAATPTSRLTESGARGRAQVLASSTACRWYGDGERPPFWAFRRAGNRQGVLMGLTRDPPAIESPSLDPSRPAHSICFPHEVPNPSSIAAMNM